MARGVGAAPGPRRREICERPVEGADQWRAGGGVAAPGDSGQPARNWHPRLHQTPHLAHTHLIACDASGKNRVDLTPDARREFAIEPALDVAEDGRQVAATVQSIASDRELDSTIALI